MDQGWRENLKNSKFQKYFFDLSNFEAIFKAEGALGERRKMGQRQRVKKKRKTSQLLGAKKSKESVHKRPSYGQITFFVYFLYEILEICGIWWPFCCNSCSTFGFEKNVFLRPHIYSIFCARQNWYIAKNGSERSFCLKNGDLWTKVEEQKWNFS